MTELEQLKIENEKLSQRIKELELKVKNEITFKNDVYYYIDSYCEIHLGDIYESEYCFKKRINVKNAFQTEEQAECVAEKIKFLLRLYDYHLRYDADFEPNWDNANQPKYYIHFDTQIKKYCLYYHFVDKDNTVYFSSEEIAQKVCDELNEEL